MSKLELFNNHHVFALQISLHQEVAVAAYGAGQTSPGGEPDAPPYVRTFGSPDRPPLGTLSPTACGIGSPFINAPSS